MFIRAFGVVATIAAFWWSSSSFGLGLGLGELKVESALASPFRATIPLRGMAEVDLDPELFSISIESNTRARIEYRLERQGDDSATLILYTREVISEPLFTFRVEIEWDRNSSARSYDVLIDPPAYDPQAPVAVAEAGAPAVAAAVELPIKADTAEQNNAEVTAAVNEPIALAGQSQLAASEVETVAAEIPQSIESSPAQINAEPRREYGPTIDGNSIWRIARAVATDNEDLNIYQWMYAIWKANPDAFYRSNMHRLNIGELIVIPLESEVAAVTRREAYRSYSDQRALLQPAPPLAEVASIENDSTTSAALQTQAQTGVEPMQAESMATPSQAAAAELPAAAAEGSTDSTNVVTGSDQLEMGESDEYLSEEAKLNALIALIDEVENSEASIVMPVAPQDTPVFAADGTVLLDGIDAVEQPASADVIATPARPLVTEVALAATPAQQDATLNAPVLASADSNSGSKTSLQIRQQKIAQMPVIGEQAPLAFVGRSIGWVDEMIATSPSWLALALGCWITLVILMLSREIRSRRLAKGVDLQPAERPILRSSPAPVMAPVISAEKTDELSVSEPVAEVDPAVKKPRAKSKKTRKVDLHADEILAKANSFMAARNSDEAAKLLELAIKLQPDQFKFVLRLLEIYHNLKQADAFESLLQRVRPNFDELQISDQIHVQVMYAQLCPRATPLIDVDQAVKAKARAEAEAELAAHAADEMDVDLSTAAVTDDSSDEDEDEEYAATQVLIMNNGTPLDEEVAEDRTAVGELLDLEVTLREVDVYLAYGLYDNAEELLLKGMKIDPNRVDYLAKLLDTYFATKNLVDFVTCAESLREMGEAANGEYWNKVEVMGYQLAPYNELFAGGKERSLDGVDAGIVKPESADFDPTANGDYHESRIAEFNVDDDITETSLQELLEDVVRSEPDAAVDEVDSRTLSTTELFMDDTALERMWADKKADETAASADEAATSADDAATSTDAAAKSADDLVAEIMAENADYEATNLNLNLDKTANINFDADNPVVMDQYDKDEDLADGERLELDKLSDEVDNLVFDEGPEIEAYDDDPDFADDEALNLDSLESDSTTLEFDQDQDLDTVDSNKQNLVEDEDEAMKFTIAEEKKADPVGAAADIGLVAQDFNANIGDGRILKFPESGTNRSPNAEFESEVRVTLQTIRDQLQYMTERLFKQERETSELRQAIQEINEQSDAKDRKNSKKSS